MEQLLADKQTMHTTEIVLAVESVRLGFPSDHAGRPCLSSPHWRDGARLRIKVDDKEVPVEFPRVFSMPELRALANATVEYTKAYTFVPQGNCGAQKWDYALRTLSGPSAGWDVRGDHYQ